MPLRIQLFQWDGEKGAARGAELRQAGFVVELECEDGARGCRNFLNQPADVVVFDLATRPSHSRETAAAIRRYKAGRRTLMLFVGGSPAEIEKTRAKVPGACFVAPEELAGRLLNFDS